MLTYAWLLLLFGGVTGEANIFNEENPISSEHFTMKMNGRSKRDIHLENMADHYDVTLMLTGKAVQIRLEKSMVNYDQTLAADIKSGNFSGYGITWMIYKADDYRGVFFVRRQLKKHDIKVEGYLLYKNAYYLVQPNSTTGHVMHQLNEQRENTPEENRRRHNHEKFKRQRHRRADVVNRTLPLCITFGRDARSLWHRKYNRGTVPHWPYEQVWYEMMYTWVAYAFESMSASMQYNYIKIVPCDKKMHLMNKFIKGMKKEKPLLSYDKFREVTCGPRAYYRFCQYQITYEDHAAPNKYTILMTGLDLRSEFGSNVYKWTRWGNICDKTPRCSAAVVEFGFTLTIFMEIANAIAVSMGSDFMPYDYKLTDNYIQSYNLTPSDRRSGKVFVNFSDTSRSRIEEFFAETKQLTCLTKRYEPKKRLHLYMGAAWNYNTQCKLLAGLDGYRASNNNQQPSASICSSGLECKLNKTSEDNEEEVLYMTPLDGTNCGYPNSCIRGVCVPPKKV